jgi:hypothetical protein
MSRWKVTKKNQEWTLDIRICKFIISKRFSSFYCADVFYVDMFILVNSEKAIHLNEGILHKSLKTAKKKVREIIELLHLEYKVDGATFQYIPSSGRCTLS